VSSGILLFVPDIFYTANGGIIGWIIDFIVASLLAPLTPIAGTIIYLIITDRKPTVTSLTPTDESGDYTL
jgi:hypothetical protein